MARKIDWKDKNMSIKLMYITNDKDIARLAESVGIERVFVDLEYLGKAERQKNFKSFISNHKIEDVSIVRKAISLSELLVRVNPINPESKEEIDKVINSGADIVMLPMFTTADEAKDFIRFVNRRAKVSLLLETAKAVENLNEILSLKGIDEIYLGLNDLHITMRLTFIFESLSNGIVDYIAKKINSKGIDFGFGGIGRMGEGELPARMILAEHYRLGSKMVILSRTFKGSKDYKELTESNWLKQEIVKVRDEERRLICWKEEQFEENRKKVIGSVNKIIEVKNEKSLIHSDT
jgi:hypothetical protein